jgi:16S rRNA (cytosine967-C5)-methyltransferase
MAGISPARRVAFQILLIIERGHAHADDLLRGDAVSALSLRDRHLSTALVLGVLRWQTPLDHRLRSLLARPKARLDPEVLIALRLGAFQLLHLDRIPARAAVDESVELVRQAGHRFASGMVNAVLRKLAQVAKEEDTESGFVSGHAFSRAANEPKVTRALAPEASCVPAITAHPEWITKRWGLFFGSDTTCAICQYDQTQPPLTLRLTTPLVEAELTQAGIALEPGELLSAARIVTSGDVTATAAFDDRRVRIQDEGSQLVAEIAGHGSTILDCCAAPGGKTLILAERNPEARIVACEASAQRLEFLRQRLAPFGGRIECRLADATALGFESEFDLVLADVPCSGTGTLSRNPEIRHRLSLEDLPRQAERQRAILARALRAARPGGRVVYSTCSLEPEENEQVIAAVLREAEGVRVASVLARLDEMQTDEILTASGADRLRSCITPEGFLRLFPGACGTDGFFVAMIEKSP